MSDWLPYATRDPIPGVGWASFDWEADPTWKLLLHSTEGGTYASARGSYSNNRFAPNVTAGPDPNRHQTVKAWQHLPFNSRSVTLADDPGGIRPNRDYVIQVEIVGYADLKSARRHGPSWLHVDSWPDWYKEGVAEILNDILDAKPIPRRNSVRWLSYPSSYGQTSVRLSTSEFDAYAGILGHMHAPENDHGDPGNLGEFVNNYLINREPPKDWFDMADEKTLRKVVDAALDAKMPAIVNRLEQHMTERTYARINDANVEKYGYRQGLFQIGAVASDSSLTGRESLIRLARLEAKVDKLIERGKGGALTETELAEIEARVQAVLAGLLCEPTDVGTVPDDADKEPKS